MYTFEEFHRASRAVMRNDISATKFTQRSRACGFNPQLGAVLRFLLWRGYRTERLVHQRRKTRCGTHRPPPARHVKALSAVGSQEELRKFPHLPLTKLTESSYTTIG